MITEPTNVNWIKLTQDQPSMRLCVNDVDCKISITRQCQLGTHIEIHASVCILTMVCL